MFSEKLKEKDGFLVYTSCTYYVDTKGNAQTTTTRIRCTFATLTRVSDVWFLNPASEKHFSIVSRWSRRPFDDTSEIQSRRVQLLFCVRNKA